MDMASHLQHLMDSRYATVRSRIISITCQTLLYGTYLCLAPLVVHVMVTNGLQNRSRKWLLAIITSTFALATVYWIMTIALTYILVDSWNGNVNACYDSDTSACTMAEPLPWLPILDDILLVNYIIADAVVIWRAWVLCSEQRKVVLMIPVVMLGINTIFYLITIALRAMLLVSEERGHKRHSLNPMIKGTQLTQQSLSLFINIFATSLIALKAWKYRKLLMENGLGIRTPTQAAKILALLAESGVIYILIGVSGLVSHAILLSLGLGVLTNVFMPLGIQLVGLYPMVVVLVVEQNRWLNSSKFCSFGTMNDVPSGLISGDQIDSTMKSPNTYIDVTFDPASPGLDVRTTSRDSMKRAVVT